MITWILVNTLRILKFDSHMTSLDRRKSYTNGIRWLIRTVSLKLLSLTLPLIQIRDCIFQLKWNETKLFIESWVEWESVDNVLHNEQVFHLKVTIKVKEKEKKKYMANNKVHCWSLLKNSHKYHNLIRLYHKFWIN